MDEIARLNWLVPLLAFLAAVVFGAVAQRSNFCTMGAVADVVNFGDWKRMRMWLLAIAVAIAGTTLLAATGRIDLAKSLYTGAKVPWLSHVVGGLLFGIGMTLGSGCGSKTLLRFGTGNLKALVVLAFLGISAYMTLKGAFAPLRAFGLDTVQLDLSGVAATSDVGALAVGLGFPAGVRLALPLAVAAALVAFVLSDRSFRASREALFAAVVIGAVIVAGWYISGYVGFVAEDPATLEEKFVRTNSGRMESYSLVAPVGFLLELLMLWTDTTRVVTFGIAGALGMAVGAAAVALATRSFRWEGFASVEDLANHVAGGILMGFGGVTAMGCSIGQGLSGVSTLAVGSILSLVAIWVGAAAGMRYQTWRVLQMA
jgi:uncharacterized membrane protein YedE/YeeE